MKTQLKKQQQGVVLIIALILIVVMTVGSIAAVRLSGMDELVNNNTRAKAMALQAAEAAINYCRYDVFNKGKLEVVPDVGDEGVAWKSMSNWGTNKANSLNYSTVLDLPGGEYKQSPECMIEDITHLIEKSAEDPEQKVGGYRITARGFSPNFRKDGQGFQEAGGQVWIQLVVTRVIA